MTAQITHYTEPEVRERAQQAGVDPDQAVRVARAEGIIPSRMTLYSLEEHLQSMLDTEEMVPAEQEEEFAQELARTLVATVEKRDRVGQFLAHVEAQAELAKKEIQRLRDRQAFYERTSERLNDYLIRTIKQLGQDGKGKWKKLEGQTVTFSLRKAPASVQVEPENEPLVPAEFKTLTIKIPAAQWEEILDLLDVEVAGKLVDAVSKAECSLNKTAIKEALQAEREVPGASLVTDRYTLQRI